MTLLVPKLTEQETAQLAVQQLAAAGADITQVRLCVEAGRGNPLEIAVPLEALRAIAEVLSHFAHGNAVTVNAVHAEVTTQQAADILGVSRPYFVGLLEEGKIPFRRLHKHRRVRLVDVLAYKEATDRERLDALQELSDLSHELGLYDD